MLSEKGTDSADISYWQLRIQAGDILLELDMCVNQQSGRLNVF